jgi:hypothetical protein
LGKSAIGYGVGISLYWIAIKYMKEAGIVSPEIQTLFWFLVTIIGVALVSGKFFHWQTADQLVGIAIIIGIAWLMFRTGG